MTSRHCARCPELTHCGGCAHFRCDVYPSYPTNGTGPAAQLYPGRHDYGDHVSCVGGLRWHDAAWVDPVALPTSLPRFIPQLGWGEFAYNWCGLADAFAVTADDLPALGSASLRRRHNVAQHQALIIHMCVKDQWLERLWSQRSGEAWAMRAARESPCFVVGPDFSLYDNTCRCTHLYNTKRSLLVGATLQKSGLLCVPFVSLAEPADVTMWTAWFRASPAVEVAATSLQTVLRYAPRDCWHQAIGLLGDLHARTAKRLSWLVVGVASMDRVDDVIAALGPNCLFTSTGPTMHALHGRSIPGSTLGACPSPRDLARENIRITQQLIASRLA